MNYFYFLFLPIFTYKIDDTTKYLTKIILKKGFQLVVITKNKKNKKNKNNKKYRTSSFFYKKVAHTDFAQEENELRFKFWNLIVEPHFFKKKKKMPILSNIINARSAVHHA
jgi:K+-sensing histidine kinase KdpD